jgi:3-hydroxyisobutyrate dehydrogenase
LEGISGSAADTPLARGKGSAMMARDFTPTFTLDGLEKDTTLIAEAMGDVGVDASILTAVLNLARRAQGLGHGDEDMAAIYHAFR